MASDLSIYDAKTTIAHMSVYWGAVSARCLASYMIMDSHRVGLLLVGASASF